MPLHHVFKPHGTSLAGHVCFTHVPTVSCTVTPHHSLLPLPCDATVLHAGDGMYLPSHSCGAQLHVTCFSHWNVGRRNDGPLLRLGPAYHEFLILSVFCHHQGKGMSQKAHQSQHNATLTEETRTQATTGSRARRAQPPSAKPQPAHKHTTEKEALIALHRVLEWFFKRHYYGNKLYLPFPGLGDLSLFKAGKGFISLLVRFLPSLNTIQ